MKSLLSTIRSKTFVLITFALFVFTACDKSEDVTPETPDEHVNKWIYENMDFWYYWTAEMPEEKGQNVQPEAYFQTLLSSSDRFSWIQSNYQELLNSLRGISKEAGFEFFIHRETAGSNTLIMKVAYVKHDSPASKAGLKRGDIITHVNNSQLNVSNYQQLVEVGMNSTFSITYNPIDYTTRTLGAPATVTLDPLQYVENPNYFAKVYTHNDRKIGYYVYNLFADGPAEGDNSYTNEMDNIFADFKAQGITDLVVDLRYNSGGVLSAAQNLASLIVKNATPTSVFSRYEYNANVTEAIKNDPSITNKSMTTPFLVKSQNVGAQLRDGRVYILTSGRTASASEMVINSLRPFMDVFLVGSTTIGKNVGSISIYDEEDTQNGYGMQPIVTKIYNGASQSDFSNGFVPQVFDNDDERLVFGLGDTREIILRRALWEITGSMTVSRTSGEKSHELIFNSFDAKKRSGVAIIESIRR